MGGHYHEETRVHPCSRTARHHRRRSHARSDPALGAAQQRYQKQRCRPAGALPLSRHRRAERGRAGRAGRSDPAAAPPDALGGDLFRRKAAECPAHRLGRVLCDRRHHALLRIPAEDGGRSPRPYAAAEDDKPAHPAAWRRVRGHAWLPLHASACGTRSPLRCCI